MGFRFQVVAARGDGGEITLRAEATRVERGNSLSSAAVNARSYNSPAAKGLEWIQLVLAGAESKSNSAGAEILLENVK